MEIKIILFSALLFYKSCLVSNVLGLPANNYKTQLNNLTKQLESQYIVINSLLADIRNVHMDYYSDQFSTIIDKLSNIEKFMEKKVNNSIRKRLKNQNHKQISEKNNTNVSINVKNTSTTKMPNTLYDKYREEQKILEMQIAQLEVIQEQQLREEREKENQNKLKMEKSLKKPDWIVIQRRINGSLDFYRNWKEYKQGFGDPNSEYFVGLWKLNRITSSAKYELYIQLESFENEQRYAHYDNFQIGMDSEDYALKSLGEYSGTAGDSLRSNLNQKFSTYDHNGDCAQKLTGGWWYSNCGFSNLNGKYLQGSMDYDSVGNGIFWDDWLGFEYSLKSVTMMILRV